MEHITWSADVRVAGGGAALVDQVRALLREHGTPVPWPRQVRPR